MTAFYHDSSRKSLFTERSRQLGPLSGPEVCQVDLLEWSPGIGVFSYHLSMLVIRSIFRAQAGLRQYYGTTVIHRDQRPSPATQNSTTLADCVRSVSPVRYAADGFYFQVLRHWILPTTARELAFKRCSITILSPQTSYPSD